MPRDVVDMNTNEDDTKVSQSRVKQVSVDERTMDDSFDSLHFWRVAPPAALDPTLLHASIGDAGLEFSLSSESFSLTSVNSRGN
jgi:hypothetical protein